MNTTNNKSTNSKKYINKNINYKFFLTIILNSTKIKHTFKNKKIMPPKNKAAQLKL